tara:strand:- start:334 stop:666 length:333 start_codon:yes stop_codon:yes gene_type:complete
MPSYYDSKKKKPGKAKVKYAKGSKIKNKKDKKEEEEELTASQKEALQNVLDEEYREKVRNAPTTKTNMGLYAKGGKVKYKKGGKVKKMSDGGIVRGMGAATRGGNFSRNG